MIHYIHNEIAKESGVFLKVAFDIKVDMSTANALVGSESNTSGGIPNPVLNGVSQGLELRQFETLGSHLENMGISSNFKPKAISAGDAIILDPAVRATFYNLLDPVSSILFLGLSMGVGVVGDDFIIGESPLGSEVSTFGMGEDGAAQYQS